MFVWFASGIVMIYYPWPAPTPSLERSWKVPFQIMGGTIGFDSARRAAAPFLARHDAVISPSSASLAIWNGRLTYALRHQLGDAERDVALVDARTGALLSPISETDAIARTRFVFHSRAAVRRVDLLARGDHYMLSGEYRDGFPAYRVELADASHSTAYVNQRAGYIVGLVTDLTRWTTWLGTVPHWLYFEWLYRRITLWLWVSYVLPAIAALAALTGIVIGIHQLFPKRRRGSWRVSAYHGVSKWHHLAGLVFGVLVLTWEVSGVLEVLGPGNLATAEQVARARAAPSEWPAPAIDEAEAASRLRAAGLLPTEPIAVELAPLSGRFGYRFQLPGGASAWVDATSGAVRGALDSTGAVSAARAALGGSAPVRSVTMLSRYDAYYYARPGRELPLPVWRVRFGDPDASALYLEPVSGKPVGYVYNASRVYRWLRDGAHSFDFPAINNRRPLWDLVLLPFMLGGTIAALTGVWLIQRRMRRMT